MTKKCLIVLCLLASSCHAGPMEMDLTADKRPPGLTTYDQRQTGKYNVHVNIKDVQFFSLSDSLAGIGGDYGDYEGDYGEILEGVGNTDTDYDAAHLTVNPIFAFLGSKPTTTRPTTSTTTEKSEPNSSEASSTVDSTSTPEAKPDSDSETKEPAVIKPASVDSKKPAAIDYEEIPVEVQYYRANQQKNHRPAANVNRYYKRQPSVQILGDVHSRASNVKIMENDHPAVKICNRGEYRDSVGRCRVRTRRGVPGLRRLINLFSSFASNKN